MAYPDGITEEMVNESAEEFVQSIHHLLPAVKTLVQDLPKQVMEDDSSPQEKAKMMVELADQLGDLLAPHLACKKGCSACCYQAVVITKDEALALSEYAGKNMYSPPPLEERDSYVEKYKGVVCPFLVDSVCSVYEVRPLPCRTHYNISKYPEICDINKYPGCDTPTLDLRPFWMAAAVAGGVEAQYGDIREFFSLNMEPDF